MIFPFIYPMVEGMHHMWVRPFWGMGWWMIIGFIALTAIGYSVYYSKYPRGAHKTKRVDPLEVVQMRLARGEISAEEFEEIKKKLTR